ncbi:hypothetical protein PP707_07845 [Acetobacter pasteurianus]|nr:hypothetical protein [Acetobacter pasteurianus]
MKSDNSISSISSISSSIVTFALKTAPLPPQEPFPSPPQCN